MNLKPKTGVLLIFLLLGLIICAGCVNTTDENPLCGTWVKSYEGGDHFIYEIHADNTVIETAIVSGEVYKVLRTITPGSNGTYMIGDNIITVSKDGKTLTETLPSKNTITYQKNNSYPVPAE